MKRDAILAFIFGSLLGLLTAFIIVFIFGL